MRHPCSVHPRPGSTKLPSGRDSTPLLAPVDTDAWPWSEEEWSARFNEVNDWIYNGLVQTNPKLSEDLWAFFSRVEADLQPDQIFDLSLWLRDVMGGSALLVEDGLRLTQ